jgi:Ser/Thr protein kinase RdoA (MazF antagonist)
MQPNPTQAEIEELLTTTPPAFSAADAVSIAVSHYGIKAQVRPLVSDKDQNFRLDADDGKQYVLKISNYAEQLQFIDFQNSALIHVSKQDPTFPSPRVIPTLKGQLHCSARCDGKTHYVRVLSWLDGLVLDDVKLEPGLVNRLGKLLARLGLVLKGFEHPGSDPPSAWDMKRAEILQDLLVYVEDPKLGQLVEKTLNQFITRVKPVLDTLRTQVIYNDMNLGNVLMDKAQPDRISGLIDFGDIVKSPLIIDLAIAAAYQLGEGDDPLAGALPMIAGYHAIRPLQETEIHLLTDLIRTRLITSLLIGSYRSNLFPENKEYILISHDPAKRALIGLDGLDSEATFDRILLFLQGGRL